MKSVMIPIITLLLGFGSEFAHSQTCFSFDQAKTDWIATRDTELENPTLLEFSALQQKQNEALLCLAEKTFENFLHFNSPIQYRKWIPNDLDRTKFENELKRTALDQTIALFSHSANVETRNFARKIIEKSKASGMGFSMTETGEAIQERPAGYVRAQGHIIMNYTVMTRDDWLFLFIHEFSHFIDSNLEKAVQNANLFFRNRPNAVTEIVTAVRSVHSFADLSTDLQNLTDQYLTLALQRGWLAEIDAWTQTFIIYQELHENGTIGNIAWADDLLAKKDPSVAMKKWMADYLQPRFHYPKDGIYQNSILLERSLFLEKVLFSR